MQGNIILDKQKEGKITFQSPSNIAIVKYWGKTGIQLPVNPSISFSLKDSYTQTSIHYLYKETESKYSFDFSFEGNSNKTFQKKLVTFLDRIKDFFPWMHKYHLSIESTNTFPHSSGIASSASSYSVLALLFAELHYRITSKSLTLKEISTIARLGSGSACRSVYGGWNIWGKTSVVPNSNQHFAVNIDMDIHSNFKTIQDTILIVSADKKAISSSIGHQLMENHPYKNGRIEQANRNAQNLLKTLKKGDWQSFIEICEAEALSLHGLMMSSTPGYTLLEPNSLHIIKKIRQFRKQNNIPVCFTIDAGPNIHVLYPESNKKEVQEFIHAELAQYCANSIFINDEIGPGAIEIK
jgi:diphosphomevalonate decarboxylase